jgi:hypothetical protein
LCHSQRNVQRRASPDPVTHHEVLLPFTDPVAGFLDRVDHVDVHLVPLETVVGER